MLFLKTLANVTQNELAAAGQKAQDLAFLHQNQMPTPASFVVLSTALDETIRLNNLKYKIDYMMSHAQVNVTGTLANVYSGVRRGLLEAKLPPGLETELRSMYEQITTPLAVGELTTERPPVRIIMSTNRPEDPENNDTIIQNVSSFEELLLGIREAWAISWHPTQLGARMREHFPENRLKVALVIQSMEEPSVSCHSYSSLPQDHKRAYLQVYYGYTDLREKIMKDYYAIDKYSLRTIASQVRDQTNVLMRTDKELTVTPSSRGKSEKVIERDLLELARLTKKAERILQTPVKCFFSIRHDTVELLWVNRLGFEVIAIEEPTVETIVEQVTTPAATITTEIKVTEPVDDFIAPTIEETITVTTPQVEETITVTAPEEKIARRGVSAKLLNASLRIVRQVVERKYVGEPASLGQMIDSLNAAGAFSRQVNGELLQRAENAVKNESEISEEDHAKILEEVAFLMDA